MKKHSFVSGGYKIVGQLFLPSASPVAAPLVILCHGFGESKEDYFELARFLSDKGLAAFAMDMMGHGESEGPRYYCDISAWVANIDSAIDYFKSDSRLDVNRAGAFGLSSGGTAILEEAAASQPKLKALVALDATVHDSLPFFLSLGFRFLVILGWLKRLITKKDLIITTKMLLGNLRLAQDNEVNQKLIDTARANNVILPLPGAAQCFLVNTIKRVKKIKIPVMVIWGEEDKVDPPPTARLLYKRLNCFKRLEIISGNGHAGHLDCQKAKVLALTAEWLGSRL